jgi:hypothetical protein
MLHLYVFCVIAGIIAVNGVPHFIKGVLGKSHTTPFGKSSNAVVNVAWGWLNFVAAALLVYYSHFHGHLLRAFAAIAVGALLMSLVLANLWSKSSK